MVVRMVGADIHAPASLYEVLRFGVDKRPVCVYHHVYTIIESTECGANSVIIENIISFRMDRVNILIACIMCAISIVMWIIRAYARVAEAIVVDNIGKVFDSIITM